jgi:hypothetical protein
MLKKMLKKWPVTLIVIGVLMLIIALAGGGSPPHPGEITELVKTTYDQGFFHGGLFGMFLAYFALSIVEELGQEGKCTEKPIS